MLFLDQNVSQLNMCTSCVFKTKLCTFFPVSLILFHVHRLLETCGMLPCCQWFERQEIYCGTFRVYSVCVCVCACLRACVSQTVWCDRLSSLTVLNNASKLSVSEVFMWATTTVPVPSWIWFVLCDSWGFWLLLLQATGSERKVLWNWKVVICFINALGCSGKWKFRNLWVCLVC